MTTPYLPSTFRITADPATTDPNVFPLVAGATFAAEKGPAFSTVTRRAVSGRQVRASWMSTPTWTIKFGYDFIRNRPGVAGQDNLRALNAFFASRLGGLGSFFYYDPDDNAVTNQAIATGTGVQTTFQLVRSYTDGRGNSFVEPIYCVWKTPTVTVAGTPTAAFTYGNYGQITFTSPPASGAAIAWTGNYLWWVRFADDQIKPAQMVKDLWSLDGITLESLKP